MCVSVEVKIGTFGLGLAVWLKASNVLHTVPYGTYIQERAPTVLTITTYQHSSATTVDNVLNQ